MITAPAETGRPCRPDREQRRHRRRHRPAASAMNAAINGAMSRASEAVDAARLRLDAQAGAMLACLEEGRAALDRAARMPPETWPQRLDVTSREWRRSPVARRPVRRRAGRRARQGVVELIRWFAILGRTADARRDADRFAQRRARRRQALARGTWRRGERAGELTGRAPEWRKPCLGRRAAGRPLPAAFARAEERTETGGWPVLVPLVEGVQASAERRRPGPRGRHIARRARGAGHFARPARRRLAGAEEQLAKAWRSGGRGGRRRGKITADAGPELIEALVRFATPPTRPRSGPARRWPRDSREPAALAEPAGALGEAMGEMVDGRWASFLLARPMTARRRLERLTRQMLALGDTLRRSRTG